MTKSPYGHMLHEYTVTRVRDIAARRAKARARISTREQVLRLRGSVRRKLRQIFGQFPARTPLCPHITGVVEREHYTIEKVIFHSRPDFPVTANLYLPKHRDRLMPAVLGLCGHSHAGKADVWYQAFMQHLARQGYICLIYDPISQGERLQYLYCKTTARPRGCCEEHNMMGKQMRLLEEFFGTWRLWDGVRALDYLLSRSEVDCTRVGVTGNSGGGTLTGYLTAFDDRITMAAPSCWVTQYLYNVENELPCDAEQIPPGMLAVGLDMTDFFIAQIPRPTLLLGQKNDFFDVRGLKAAYAELRRFYKLLGAEENIELFIGPSGHGYSVHNREAMYGFFNKHANVRANRRERSCQIAPENEETLRATAKGQVPTRGQRVFDFICEKALDMSAQRKALSPKALCARITQCLALPKRAGTPHSRVLRPSAADEGGPDAVSRFTVETERGIQALVHVFRKEGALYHWPAIKQATVYVPHISSSDDVATGKTPLKEILFSVDTRGLGELTPQTCGGGDFFASYGYDYFYASCGDMLNESLCGRRVHDLLRVLDLFQATGTQAVHLVGRGLGAVLAAFAGCLHPVVKEVTLHNTLLSYHELTQTPVQSWPASSLVSGVLREFDLPDCYRLLADRKRLRLINPWTWRMQSWRQEKLQNHLKALNLDRRTLCRI